MHGLDKLHDEIVASFQGDDFMNDSKLTGEFLLGYHCQRQAFRPSGVGTASEDDVVEDNVTDLTTSN